MNVSAGKASVQPGTRVRAERGTTVKITVTSDAADEFHLHGYDESARLEPGRPAVVQIRADRAGVFEAELHGAHLRLFELQVG
ncbi:hypothetical protein [Actinomadura flavalba]|uniref:hypothetical protein n=1 Tax=Actinomadura flavalba TaxID=1120938 RepID=UPI0006877AA0|nr:hypothetical protein [Actinomadura flavalba]